MQIGLKITIEDSNLIISESILRNEILRDIYARGKENSYYVSLNEESSSIPLSCFNFFIYNLEYREDNLDPERIAEIVHQKFKRIFIQDVHNIDNESLKVLRYYAIKQGGKIEVSSTVEGVLRNSKAIAELINLGFRVIFYGGSGDNFYPLSLLNGIAGENNKIMFSNVPSETSRKYDEPSAYSEEELELLEEAGNALYVLPSSFIKSKGAALYKDIIKMVNKGIINEDTYSFSLLDVSILNKINTRLTERMKKVMVEYADLENNELKNKILAGQLYYKAGLWAQSGEALREVMIDLYKSKDYKTLVNTMETLMKISEPTDKDNFRYAVSLNHIGNARRAIKIFEKLMQSDYFHNNPQDIVEYVKIVYERNGFDRANRMLEGFVSKMHPEILGNLYLELSSIAISEGDEANVDYLLSKADELLKSDKRSRCEFSRLRGNLFLMRKDLDSALKNYEKSFEFAKEINDYVLMAKTMNNIGILYSQELKVSEGLEYFDQSRKYSLKGGDYSTYSITTANMIPLAYDLNDEKLSFKYLQEIEGIPRYDKESIALANGYFSIADWYVRKGDLLKAIEQINKGLNYSLEKLNNFEISSFLFKLALFKIIIGHDASLELETARIFADKYSEEYSYWESEIAFFSGEIDEARKFVHKAYKDIESLGNKQLIMEDGSRDTLYELLSGGNNVNTKLFAMRTGSPDVNAYLILIRYLLMEKTYETAEKELKQLDSPFFYELGVAVLNAVEGKYFRTSYPGLVNIYEAIRKSNLPR
ncbi:MAG: hypothetical protein M1515_00735 [Candidatus Thermoplasmatota archaeon]|nr:hypothetical protein [Candidatus Thermoplasmatota archaeon]